MTTCPNRFTLDLLENFQSLKNRYFIGDKELEDLAKLPSCKPTYMSRWEVVWVVITSPLRIIEIVCIKTFALLLESLSFSTSGRKFYVIASQKYRELDFVFSYLSWKSNLLVPAYNEYREIDDDIYALDSIPLSQINDPIISESLHAKITKVGFNSRIGKGLCHGGVTWFNYLFLRGLEGSKLAKGCETYTEYAEKIASLFAEGQPKQAALIQSLYGLENKLFPMNQIPLNIHPERITEEITNLCDGVFYVVTGKHAISYVKVGKEQFVWDPGIGLIKIDKIKDLLSFFREHPSFVLQQLIPPTLITRIGAWLGIR